MLPPLSNLQSSFHRENLNFVAQPLHKLPDLAISTNPHGAVTMESHSNPATATTKDTAWSKSFALVVMESQRQHSIVPSAMW